VTLVINQVVGCYYFLPGLSSFRASLLLAGTALYFYTAWLNVWAPGR